MAEVLCGFGASKLCMRMAGILRDPGFLFTIVIPFISGIPLEFLR